MIITRNNEYVEYGSTLEGFNDSSLPLKGWSIYTGIYPIPEQVYIPSEQERISQLWQSAHDYEFNEISGSAIGLLTMGVIQVLPKCIAVQNWIKSIWTLYYERKENGSFDTDFSSCGSCPYTVPELMQEVGL